jgi:hypothetical protein
LKVFFSLLVVGIILISIGFYLQYYFGSLPNWSYIPKDIFMTTGVSITISGVVIAALDIIGGTVVLIRSRRSVRSVEAE